MYKHMLVDMSDDEGVLNPSTVILKIKAPKGTKGTFIDQILGDTIHDENEFLLPPNSKLKVRKVIIKDAPGDLKGKYTFVEAEIVKLEKIPREINKGKNKHLERFRRKGGIVGCF